MPTTKPTALDVAVATANFFSALPEVLGVHLFGSFARNGDGDDLDMVVCVPHDVAERFYRAIIQPGKHILDFYVGTSSQRFFAALEVLNLSPQQRIELCDRKGGVLLDIFLFPQDWLTNLETLQRRLPHKDPHFMDNIARDALRFDALTMVFNDLCFCGETSTRVNHDGEMICADYPDCVDPT